MGDVADIMEYRAYARGFALDENSHICQWVDFLWTRDMRNHIQPMSWTVAAVNSLDHVFLATLTTYFLIRFSNSPEYGVDCGIPIFEILALLAGLNYLYVPFLFLKAFS